MYATWQNLELDGFRRYIRTRNGTSAMRCQLGVTSHGDRLTLKDWNYSDTEELESTPVDGGFVLYKDCTEFHR